MAKTTALDIMPRFNRRSVRATEGLVSALSSSPASPFTRFDPAMGRGYRIGNSVVVPAGAGFSAAVPPVVLANHGDPSKIFRWKITLCTGVPVGVADPVNDGAGLRYIIRSRMENDNIPRTCFVTLGDAQAIYAPGRSLSVMAFNPNGFDLQAEIALDEYVGGISVWEDVAIFEGLAAETPLDFPPFCSRFQVYSPGAAAPAPRIRAYAPGGILVYDDVLPVPATPIPISRIPNTDYTIDVTGGIPQNHAVLFVCDG